MRTARLRYSGLGLLGLVVIGGLLVGWLLLSHLLFIIIVIMVVFFSMLFAAAWDGVRQRTPASLQSRGIDPNAPPPPDGNLRRDFSTRLPFSVGRQVQVITVGSAGAGPLTRVRPPAARPAAGAKRPGAARPARVRPRGDLLPPGATVTFARESREAGVDGLLTALDGELIGLLPVKKRVAEIGSLLLVDRARQRFGLSASRPNLHMCFTGPPGTGKTTVALKMADLLHRLGYLEKGHLVHVMRDDLVGEYIGQTAPKTKQVLSSSMGGLLFIDEAYSLFRADDSRDYGQECVDILMQVMENDRDNLVVVLAGYKDRMDRFFESNPGMRSRVAHHLDFAAYQTGELLAIGQLMLDRSSYYLSAEALTAFRDYLARQKAQPEFANARSVRNALESARLRHAHRLAAEPERPWNKDDLMRLEPSDVLLASS